MRDSIAASERDLLQFHESSIDVAVERGELAADTDARQLAFELDALARSAGTSSLLLDDSSMFTMARKAILGRLRADATDPSLLPASPK